MANTLRIKRRLTGASGAPSALANAELAYNEVNDTLYYGKGSNDGAATSIVAIGGSGTFATKTYVDNAVTAATPSGVAYLAQSNTFTSTNIFNGTSTLDIAGTWKIDNVTVNVNAAELNVLDGAAANTVVNSKAVIYGSAGELAASSISTTGNGTVGGNLTVSGNLTVNGTTTSINSTTLNVDDINIVLGDTATPSDATADGGGITLKGTSDKTFNWVDATDAWTSSEHMNLASGKAYYINGTQVLSGSALGSGVTSSSLTSVGTIATGTWQGTAVGVAYGGTGATDAPTARTNLGLAIGTDVQAYNSTLAAVAGGTYTGDDSITTLGTIATGTWQGGTIGVSYGGTGTTSSTGSGSVVLSNSPSLTTPSLGAASATSINKVAITAPSSSATLTIADGKTLTASNTLTFTGTDSSSVAFGAGGTVVYENTVCSAIANCELDGGSF